MHRSVVAAVVAAALVAGGGAAWAWDARANGTATAESRDRVASAVAAGQSDERSGADLSGRSADLTGQGLLGDSAAALSQAIPAAQAVLDASAGKVADDAARQQLASAIALAQAAVAGSVAPARADELATALSSAAGAVTAAQQAWEADQAAKAAAATASARAAASATARATPTPVDSCQTTYHGPAFYTSEPSATGTGSNGDIPASAMAPVSWATDSRGVGYWLVKAATASLEQLDVAFRAQFGHDLDIDLAYRDYATQVAMRAALGASVAAKPGTSNHGWGTAIDVPEWPCEYGRHTPQRDWLVAQGPQYGWYPDPNEYWHFDYKP